VLRVKEPATIIHPDHPSIKIAEGYYFISQVEGEIDYTPKRIKMKYEKMNRKELIIELEKIANMEFPGNVAKQNAEKIVKILRKTEIKNNI
jgi:hypothetical protein